MIFGGQYANDSNGLGLELPHPTYGGLGADVDGDTIAVHLPIGEEAQLEAKLLLSPVGNHFNVADGSFMHAPAHEGLAGLYYATDIKEGTPIACRRLSDLEHLYYKKIIDINSPIDWRAGEQKLSCYGRLLIEEQTGISIDHVLDKNYTDSYYTDIITLHGENATAIMYFMQTLGYDVATKAAHSVCLNSLHNDKYDNWLKGEIAKVKEETKLLPRNVGLLRVQEVLDNAYKVWVGEGESDLQFYAKAASRLSEVQIRQLAIAKGIQVNIKGEAVGVIYGNYTIGLGVHEYFASITGARAAQIAKVELTPASGYLTRRLVSAARDLLITEFDCGSTSLVPLEDIYGHVDGEGYIQVEHVEGKARSVFTCNAVGGLCACCYGITAETQELPAIGYAVGTLAAQSMSERVTQATLKLKHLSGAGRVSATSTHIAAPIAGVVTVSEGAISIGVFTYPILSDMVLDVEHNDVVTKGQLVLQAPCPILSTLEQINHYLECRGTGTAVTSCATGTLSYAKGKIMVGDTICGKLHNYPPSRWAGEHVKKGEALVGGLVNMRPIFNNDPTEFFTCILHEIKKIVGGVHGQHIEVIVRAMTELIDTDKGISYRREEKGDMKLTGITATSASDPIDLRALSFGYIGQNIERLVTAVCNNTDTAVTNIIRGTS